MAEEEKLFAEVEEYGMEINTPDRSSFREAAMPVYKEYGLANAFGRILTLENIPRMIADAMLNITTSTFLIIILINVLLLIVGLFMDTSAAVVILVPILLPIALEIGMNPVHFGIIMIVNLSIGFITPPLGVNLFISSGISGLRIETIARAVVPFFIAMILSLIAIILIPDLSLFLIELFK